MDAAVFEAVPFRSAIADGCTHVLVLCTRPKRERRGVLPPLEVRLQGRGVGGILGRRAEGQGVCVPVWSA